MRKVLIVAAAIFALLLAGCFLEPSKGTGGTLQVIVDPGLLAKNMEPSEPLTCASYDIQLSGPTSVGPVNVTGNTTFNDLAPGSYTVTVIGKNENELAIGEGSNTASVNINVTESVTVAVVEYDGQGTFDLTVTWDPGVLNVPNLEGFMKPLGGTETEFSWDTEVDGEATHNALYDVGWYINRVLVYDDSALSGGYAESVRIAKDLTTTGNVYVTVTAGTGNLDVYIENDFFDPLTVTGTPAVGSEIYLLAGGASKSIVAATAPVAADVYVWFEDGIEKSISGDTYTLDLVNYAVDRPVRIDCIAYTADTKHAGSGNWQVELFGTEAQQFSGQFTASAAGIPFFAQVKTLQQGVVSTITGTTVDPGIGPTPFTINSGIDEGEYRLFVCEETLEADQTYFPGEPYEYWPDNVFVPHDPDDFYDFGTLDS